eukprot:GHVR01188887.1.p1 GENE.GHVR01188887.1~~GHVR01188887.1.p1  ORF type:complete len:110 (-),score=14.87 GHVR01188887.1:181-510(-)
MARRCGCGMGRFARSNIASTANASWVECNFVGYGAQHMTNRAPITDKVTGLRQRRRANGSWRVWWEPNQSARDLGFDAVELNADRATWSVREAKRLNEDVDRKRKGDTA